MKTALIMSKEEALELPPAKRPLCYRLPSKIYHDIFEAVGEASLCWNPRPSNEEFNSDEASDVAVRLGFKIAEELERMGITYEQINPNGNHNSKLTLDNELMVFFYENDFYPLSNFSAFRVRWKGILFNTSEQAYHWEKFPGMPLQSDIIEAMSAHEAFKLAEQYKSAVRKDWVDVRVDVMREILREKVEQHEYVRRKLLATGNRELVENSWRDGFWGWGENRTGKNMLGKLWMELRSELRGNST